VLHEIEKAVVTIKILKKEERDSGAVWKAESVE
jgi:hypothetical protein